MTIINAVTKRPRSISFHSSWHSTNHSRSYKRATHVLRFLSQWRKCVFFFEWRALAYGACFAWRKRDATSTTLTQAILSTNLPDSVKVSLCHVDFGSKELPKWIHTDWNGRADYLQHHPPNQSLHLTSAWHIAHHGGEPNSEKGAILNNSSLYSAMF